jgi:hypothetical protein
MRYNKNYLLLFMIFCYMIPIYYVYYYYNKNYSVSSIICNEKCKHIILFFMILMGIGTFLYEVERNDTLSILFISILLINIYLLILTNEKNMLHYVFAFFIFATILFFMIRHCYLRKCNNILLLSLLLEIVLLVAMIVNIQGNIYYYEISYILNFAFYYLYLHYHLYHLYHL